MTGGRTAPPKPTRRKLNHRIPFKERDFIAWDGEADTQRDNYILFGCSKGHEVSSPKLRFTECAELLMQVARRYPQHIHVAFAFNYDVSMMCASLPEELRTQLAKKGYIYFRHYRIEWRPFKWFIITDRSTKTRIQIYDIFTFFVCSAMKAWADYLPDEPIYEEVKHGKEERQDFRYEDLEHIRRYMRLELALYVKLAVRLRTLLAELGVHPKGWYGPGAVSAAAMTKFGVKHAMDKQLPRGVIQASQYAYFGGRFEGYYTGEYVGPVYSYDRRSAYPDALREVPNLARGFWQHRDHPNGRPHHPRCIDFSLYRVLYRKRDTHSALFTPSPFPFRDLRYTIHYPNHVVGWYWGVEVNAAIEGLQPGDQLDILESWEFIPETPTRPFQFLEDLFTQRQVWKDAKNPIQYAAKLILNSIYGKLAQRVGWNQKTGTAPTWHQLEWAGYATAHCRAQMYRAITQNPSAIISVETDGLFSTAPLEFPPDTHKLGDWESEEYDGLIYVQSGFYFLKRGTTWEKVRIRGFSPGDIDIETVREALPTLDTLTAHTHRFAGLRGYHNKPELAKWIDANREIIWGGGGKRVHYDKLCPKCNGANVALHSLVITKPHGGESVQHVLPWLNQEINPWWEHENVDRTLRLLTQS